MMLRMLLVALCVTTLYISCTEGAGISGCIQPEDCGEIGEGRYRDCRYCNTFITCDNGVASVTTCNPWNTSIYDSVHGVCASDTNGECNDRFEPVFGTSGPNVTGPTVQSCPNGTNPCCVSSCDGLPDGVYGSCLTCNGYVSCSNGIFYEMMCAGGLVWDDAIKACAVSSQTCQGEIIPVEQNCTQTQECRSALSETSNKFCVEVPEGTTVVGVKLIRIGGPGSPFPAIPCTLGANYGIDTGVRSGQNYTFLYTKLGCCAEFKLDICPPEIPEK